MTDRPREGGRFAPEHPDEAFVSAVGEREPAGTGEVAEAVGCSRQNADYRLRKLRDTGEVRSKKVGGNLAWMLREGE